MGLSVLLYFLILILLKNYLQATSITWIFLWKMTILTLVSWAPPFLFKWVMRKIDPSDYEKIMRNHNQTFERMASRSAAY